MKIEAENLVYGLNPSFEVATAGRRIIQQAFIQDNAKNTARLNKLRSKLESLNVPVSEVDKNQLWNMSNTKDHQGIILSCDPFQYGDVDTCLAADRVLLIDNVEDPQNVGAILRSADCFGFHHVLLPNKGVPGIYGSVLKASAGACEWLHIAKSATANKYVNLAQKADFHVAALDASGKMDVETLAAMPPKKLLLVIGGEDRSVGQYILNIADAVLNIPTRGRVNSLNASVAAGVAMNLLSLPNE